MHRIRDNQENETFENVSSAWDNYSRRKHKRPEIRNYEEHLMENLNRVLQCLVDESWEPSGYTQKVIHDKKERLIAKAPAMDHVLEAAAILPYEKALYDYSSYRAPAVKPGMGTMAFYKILRNELYSHSQKEMYYYIAMDVHHYFPSIDKAIMKEKISRCVKPGKLQRVLYKVVDSYLQGAPLGIKVSQIYGQLYLADFDRLAMRFFDIYDDEEKLNYWTSRYIEHRIMNASSVEDERDLARGSLYLAHKFRMYVADGVPSYLRFVDNILYRHEDKAVLHILKELTVMHLARDYHLTMNKDYNVRPTYMGIRICGYVFFHDHVEISKRNKKELCRRVKNLQKKGFTEEQIRVKLSSLFGFAKHADTTHLFKSIGMEKTLGKIIKKKKAHVPFEGMNPEQKRRFSSICSTMLNNVNGGGCSGSPYKILLEDYTVLNSIINKERTIKEIPESNGTMRSIPDEIPAEVLAIRYKHILNTIEDMFGNEDYEFEKVKRRDGTETSVDAEFYSYTGSKVLIDQAKKDFGHEDLPCPTVIQEFETSNGKKFFKFT